MYRKREQRPIKTNPEGTFSIYKGISAGSLLFRPSYLRSYNSYSILESLLLFYAMDYCNQEIYKLRYQWRIYCSKGRILSFKLSFYRSIVWVVSLELLLLACKSSFLNV